MSPPTSVAAISTIAMSVAPGVPAMAKIVGYDAITPAMLEVYVAERVKLLTGGQQSPVMNSNAPEFPLAIPK